MPDIVVIRCWLVSLKFGFGVCDEFFKGVFGDSFWVIGHMERLFLFEGVDIGVASNSVFEN